VSWIELGRIGAPYGVKGWVHVESFTDPPERLLQYAPWSVRLARGERQIVKLAEGRAHGERLVARVEGVEDRTDAAALTGAIIEVERARLPPPGAREHYCADLVGLAVRNLEGASLGTVAYFVNGRGGLIMVVRDKEGREHWVLAIPRHLRKVDLAAAEVLVDWPLEAQ
jgi:16S rRNA processing protein RimM